MPKEKKKNNPEGMFRRGRIWYSEFVHLGKRHVKSHRVSSLVIAKEKHAIFYGDVVSGRYEKQLREKEKAKKQGMNFSDLSTWYLDLSQVQSLASYKRICGCFKNFNSEFGKTRIIDLKQTDLSEYQTKRSAAGRAAATVDMEIKIVKTALTLAESNDMISMDAMKPFRRTKRLLKSGDNARGRVFSFDEVQGLLQHPAKHLRPVILFAVFTGMRAGELRGLRFSHIDFQKQFIRLGANDTKEHKPKNIPLNYHLMEELREIGKVRRLDNDFIFTYRGREIKEANNVKKSFRTACKKAGIPYGRKEKNGVTFHDLRRTVKTNMMEAGIDPAFRDKILGHSLKGMDVNYLQFSDESLTKAMDIFTQWMDDRLYQVADDIAFQNVATGN